MLNIIYQVHAIPYFHKTKNLVFWRKPTQEERLHRKGEFVVKCKTADANGKWSYYACIINL